MRAETKDDGAATVTKLLLWGFIGWCLFWLTIGAWYSVPNVEDLSLAALPRDQGLFRSIYIMMLSYDGRYFTNLLHGLNPLAFDWIEGYMLVPLVAISILTLCLSFLFSSLQLGKNRTSRLMAALLLVSVHFALTPSLAYDLYVMISSIVYLWPWVFICLWVGAFLRYRKGQGQYWLLMAMLCLICGIGMNEMFLSVNLALLAALVLYESVTEHRQQWRGLTLMIVMGLLSTLLFVTSPGISNRLAGDSQGFQPMRLQQMWVDSISDFVTYSFHWAFMSPLLIASSLIIGSLLGPIPHVRYRGIAFMMGLIITYSMTLAFYLTVAGENKDASRIFTSILLGFQLVVASGVLLFLSSKRFLRSPKWVVGMTVTLVLGLAIPNNNYMLLITEFREGTLTYYKSAMKERYTTLLEAADSDTRYKRAVVSQLTTVPKTIQLSTVMEPQRSTPHWNRAYEAYFRLDEVMYSTDTVTKCNFLFP